MQAAFLLLLVCVVPFASAEEVLRVGTSEDYPPFSVAGRGFDVDVAREMARDLGVRVEWVRFRWPELATRLRRGGFDVAMSGVTWRPERDVVGWMTRAVAVGGPCVVGASAPKRVGVNRGGVLERWATERFQETALVRVDDNLSLPSRLARGEIDAFVTDSFEAPRMAAPGSALHCEPPRDRKVYWVGPARAEELGPRLDDWIARHEETLRELRQRWLGPDARERTELDHVVDLIARRLELMPLVAAAKRSAEREIADPKRESAVLADVASDAVRRGLAPEGVERLYRALIALARAVQERSSSSGATLDLTGDLRPAISRLDRRIVASLAASVPIDGDALGARLVLLDRILRPEEIRSIHDSLLAMRRSRTSVAPKPPRSGGASRKVSTNAFFASSSRTRPR